MAVDLVYRYDGSFEGLLCCVFESYDQKEIPTDILAPERGQGSLFMVKEIVTDAEKARRVARSIPQRIGREAFDFVRQSFLTCFGQKEIYILLFLRKGYREGAKIMQMLADDTVHTLMKAVQHLQNESHLLKGFIRFSAAGGVLVSEIGPKNYVLPFLIAHFSERYPEERFMIYDMTHRMALVYQPYQAAIVPVDALALPEADAEELAFRKLWKVFYDTIEIKARHHPKGRMNLLPKWYWKYMTEFSTEQRGKKKLVLGELLVGKGMNRTMEEE